MHLIIHKNRDIQKGCYEANYERERERERETGYTTKVERSGVHVKGRRTEIS